MSFGQKAVNALFLLHPEIKQKFDRNIGSGNIFNGDQSDFFYIPIEMAPRYIYYADIFFYFRVFLEIAVPNILGLILQDTEARSIPLNVYMDWTRDNLPLTLRREYLKIDW